MERNEEGLRSDAERKEFVFIDTCNLYSEINFSYTGQSLNLCQLSSRSALDKS